MSGLRSEEYGVHIRPRGRHRVVNGSKVEYGAAVQIGAQMGLGNGGRTISRKWRRGNGGGWMTRGEG